MLRQLVEKLQYRSDTLSLRLAACRFMEAVGMQTLHMRCIRLTVIVMIYIADMWSAAYTGYSHQHHQGKGCFACPHDRVTDKKHAVGLVFQVEE